MITPTYVQTMARYNRWQNRSLYSAAAQLGDAARRENRGAFFGSIHATLSHLLWGDRTWLARFSGTTPPGGSIRESADYVSDWESLSRERAATDDAILAWARHLEPAWLEGQLSWHSGMINRTITRPCALLAVHFFNHQTHHRGQVHAMLTAAGAKPEDTDLPIMPD